MPKVGFSSQQMSAGPYTRGGLHDIVDAVGRYLKENAEGQGPASSFESGNGLHLRVGRGEFLLAPYSRSGPVKPDNVSANVVYSFAELKELDLPSPAPIIEGFLNSGETVLLAARGKVGKSRLVQQMSLSLVNGDEFLGMAVRQRRRVLIVDLENRTPTLRDRLLKMAGPQAEVDGLFVWCSSSLSDETIDCSPEGIERLREFIEQTQADVLIIDPWRLFLGKDENSADEVVGGLKRLSRLRQSYPSLTIVIVHHLRKDRFENPRSLLAEPRLWTDAVSGHHALSSHVDACYGLERQRPEADEDELIVFGGVARNSEPRTILLEDDEDTLRFEVEHSAEAVDALLTKAQKPIWEAAKKLSQFTFSKLSTDSGTKNKKAVSSVLRKATAQGLLRHEGRTYTVLCE